MPGLCKIKFNIEVALACLIFFIWIPHVSCDGPVNASGISNWTCSCASAFQGTQSYALGHNCSTSCDCTPVRSSDGRWACNCAADKFPEIATNDHDTKCFSACNCTSSAGSSIVDTQASRKPVYSKVVVIILLVCVILTTFAFVASVVCCVHRRDKCSIQPPLFSSDRQISYNSGTNLISHRSTSEPELRILIGSPLNPIKGCFHKASFLFRSKAGTIHGTIIQFTYSDLENATNKFSDSNIIGLGGSSQVYIGQIKEGRTVAIKRLKTPGGADADYLFLTEIELLSRLHHYHVVPLLGYCSESQGKHAERLLVFEYLPNGNLRDCLDGAFEKKLDWGSRVAIALGAARGLEYLHEAAAPRILHRDVKSTNILLDANWRAKITDLGMAKRLKTDGVLSCSSSPARMQGTFGYFAPEYAITGRGSLKSDVFSFGVVLLELITGRQPIDKSANRGQESLVIWATPRLQDSRCVSLELPDPNLNGKFPEEELQIMAYLAKECLLMDPDHRPTMSEVVQILSTIAPERSTRRNISVDLFQKSFVGTKQLKRDRSNKCSGRYSLPLDIDSTLCVDDNNNNHKQETDNVASDYMDRLILLSSKARSWRALDDETVDLTEPRFESFCLANVNKDSRSSI